MTLKNSTIAVITGSRAEYGLLRWIIEELNNSKHINFKLIVTGMHLSAEFGLTVKQIKNDNFKISREIEMLLSSDTPSAIAKSIGVGLLGFADVFKEIKPDLIIVLGDRYEILSACIAAVTANIPIAHIHGGEITHGAIDDSIRHSITKMSHLHFVANSNYKKRVIQMGECEERVYEVGGLGIDNIYKLDLLPKKQLENELNIEFQKRNLLITYHPVTLEKGTNEFQIQEILNTLSNYGEINLIFTLSNADYEGRLINNKIIDFCNNTKNSHYFTSLGQKRYLSCLKYVDGVLGNSSSGIIEVPTFKKGTIDIGNRQKGRLKATSIIECSCNKNDIIKSLNKLYSDDFQTNLLSTINPYGDGGASSKIINILKTIDLKGLTNKIFNDINF